MTETLANGYSSESTQRELSNEYQHDRVWMVFKNLCICVLWSKVALALEGLKKYHIVPLHFFKVLITILTTVKLSFIRYFKES